MRRRLHRGRHVLARSLQATKFYRDQGAYASMAQKVQKMRCECDARMSVKKAQARRRADGLRWPQPLSITAINHELTHCKPLAVNFAGNDSAYR